MEYGIGLKSQDVLVLLKLVAKRNEAWTYAQLAADLGLSPSQVHAAIRRILQSGLAVEKNGQVQVNIHNLEDFLLHALRYISMPARGPKSRRMATLTSAPPLASVFLNDGEPIVWPDPSGDTRGESLEPIHKSASTAAWRDPERYELLVISDALRAGRARERQAAAKAHNWSRDPAGCHANRRADTGFLKCLVQRRCHEPRSRGCGMCFGWASGT